MRKENLGGVSGRRGLARERERADKGTGFFPCVKKEKRTGSMFWILCGICFRFVFLFSGRGERKGSKGELDIYFIGSRPRVCV